MKHFIICLLLILQTFFAAYAGASPAIPPRPAAGSGMILRRSHTVRVPPAEIRVLASSQWPYSAWSLSSWRVTERGTSLEKDTDRYS